MQKLMSIILIILHVVQSDMVTSEGKPQVRLSQVTIKVSNFKRVCKYLSMLSRYHCDLSYFLLNPC